MMKKRGMALLVVSVLAMGASSEAALLVYEGFDYSVGSLSGQSGGSGWTGAWTSGDNYSVAANSLAMANLPFATVGGSAVGQSTVNRDFSYAIDFDSEGIYYGSFIMKRTGWESTDGGGEWFDVHLRSSSYKRLAKFGITSGEQFQVGLDASTAKGGDAATTNPYFMVFKLVTHAGSTPDEYYLKSYAETDTVDLTETASWTATKTYSTNGIANKFTLWAGTDGDDGNGVFQAAIDEIRIGETWNDVIPEPATMGLVILCSGALVFFRRLMI